MEVSLPAWLRRRDVLAALAIALVVFAVYHRVLANQFLSLWDDDLYVTGVSEIREITLGNLERIFTSVYVGHYAPVQMVSYMLDHAVWGLKPFGFALTDLLLHAMNAVLVFALLRTFRISILGAVAGALLFAIHPLQVESVAWVSQRKTLLSMFFFLASVLLYVDYRGRDGWRRKAIYVASNAAFLLALLSKPAAVILPIVLVLYDVLIRRDPPTWRMLADKISFATVSAAAAGLAYWSQGTQMHGGRAPGWHGGSPYHTLLTMVPVFRAYLGKLVWPADLSVIYSPAIKTSVDADVLLSAAAVLVALAAPLVVGGVQRRQIAFWTAVSILGIVPVSQIVPLASLMNDRYLYFPLVGIAGVLAAFVSSAPQGFRVPLGVALVLAALALGVASSSRTSAWADSVTLWEDAAAKNPRDPMIQYGLGLAHDNAGNLGAAIRAYDRALQINSDYVDPLYNMGLAHLLRGELPEARVALERLVTINPRLGDATRLLGHVLYCQGEFSRAARVYEIAAQMSPRDPEVLNYLSLAMANAGDAAASRAAFDEAIQRGGDRAQLLVARASLESLARREAPALTFLEAAIAAGYADIESLRHDRELEYVRASPRFEVVLGHIRQAVSSK
jgi:protein O-mannosyl-transferase